MNQHSQTVHRGWSLALAIGLWMTHSGIVLTGGMLAFPLGGVQIFGLSLIGDVLFQGKEWDVPFLVFLATGWLAWILVACSCVLRGRQAYAWTMLAAFVFFVVQLIVVVPNEHIPQQTLATCIPFFLLSLVAIIRILWLSFGVGDDVHTPPVGV